MRAIVILSFVSCAACSVIEQPSGLIPRWTTAWKQVASATDRQRLADWRASFLTAVDVAKKAGHGAEIAQEGPLFDPDSTIGPAGIPNGLYQCRLFKVGSKPNSGSPAYLAGPPSLCRVKAQRGLQRFNKFGGQQRYVGLIFPGDAVHRVFLGTLVLGDETRALQYGQDELRDSAGYVDRIGPDRWRIVMPQPHFEALLDVIELVPASARQSR